MSGAPRLPPERPLAAAGVEGSSCGQVRGPLAVFECLLFACAATDAFGSIEAEMGIETAAAESSSEVSGAAVDCKMAVASAGLDTVAISASLSSRRIFPGVTGRCEEALGVSCSLA